MAPSLFKKLGTAAAVASFYAVRATATTTTQTYQLSEEYTADNFLEKFDFFESTYTSGDSWDSSHGYVNYRSLADAQSLGLVSTTSAGQIYLGPDTTNTFNASAKGRDSIRLTSKASYNTGLLVASFAHLPVQACGAWPAFWSYGSPWLQAGEIDYYEGWNLMGYNRMAMHVNTTLAGSCALSTTGIDGTVLTSDCDQTVDGSGCGVKDAVDKGVWGATSGATFAMEWTDEAIKVWSWAAGAVPADVTAGTPVPATTTWGNPTLMVEQSGCDIDKAFANQQLVFNIDFCGDTAGSPSIFNATCAAVGDTCASYVANNPAAFAETYFLVEGIKYYELGDAPAVVVSSTSSAADGGLAQATGSILGSTLGAAAPSTTPLTTSTSTMDALDAGLIPGSPVTSSFSHSTSYVYATQTSTDETGSETTVVVVVDTTICPVTASEATASHTTTVVKAETTNSVALSSFSAVPLPPVAQQTSVSSDSPVAVASSAASYSPSLVAPTTTYTLTSHSTLTSELLTTSTIFSTSSSTITSCASTASLCHVGDVTTVVVAVSTTVCPVTAITQTTLSTMIGSGIVPPVQSSHAPIPVVISAETTDVSPFTGIGPAPSVQPTTSSSSSSSTSTTVKLSSATSSSSKTSSVKQSTAHPSSSSKTSTTSKPSTQTASATEVISMTDISGALETASVEPSSLAIDWGTTLTITTATGAGSVPTATGKPTTASSTSVVAAAQETCSGIDCVVVSSGATRLGGGGGDIALVVIALGAGAGILI